MFFNNILKVEPKILSKQIIKDVIVNVIVFEENNSYEVHSELVYIYKGHYFILANMKKKHKIIQLKVVDVFHNVIELENGLKFSAIDLINKNFVIHSVYKTTKLYLNNNRINYILEDTEINNKNILKSFFKTLNLIFNNKMFYDSYYRFKDERKNLTTDFIVCDYDNKIKFNVFKLFFFNIGLLKTISSSKYENLNCNTMYNNEINCCSYWP